MRGLLDAPQVQTCSILLDATHSAAVGNPRNAECCSHLASIQKACKAQCLVQRSE